MVKKFYVGLLFSASLVNVFSYPMESDIKLSTKAEKEEEINSDGELNIPEGFKVPTGTFLEKSEYWDELCRSVGAHLYHNTQLFGKSRQARQSTPATNQESLWTEPTEDKMIIENATKNIPNEVRNLIYHLRA